MAETEPYSWNIGPWDVWIAPYGTAEPTDAGEPDEDWTELGETDGDQSVAFRETITEFYSNKRRAPGKSIRTDEGYDVSVTVVDSTLEMIAYMLNDPVNIQDNGTSYRLPLARGQAPAQWALLLRDPQGSPYDSDKASHIYIPLAESRGAPTITRGRNQRLQLPMMFHAMWDDSQAEGEELGWMTVQQ